MLRPLLNSPADNALTLHAHHKPCSKHLISISMQTTHSVWARRRPILDSTVGPHRPVMASTLGPWSIASISCPPSACARHHLQGTQISQSCTYLSELRRQVLLCCMLQLAGMRVENGAQVVAGPVKFRTLSHGMSELADSMPHKSGALCWGTGCGQLLEHQAPIVERLHACSPLGVHGMSKHLLRSRNPGPGHVELKGNTFSPGGSCKPH